LALHAPRVTRGLLVALGVYFAMTWIAGGMENPLVGIAFGANGRPLILGGEPWRLVVSMFLHANLLHLAVNGYALYLLGGYLEAFYGHWKFLFLFLLSGMVGSAASATFAEVTSVGASGGVFGVLGAILVFTLKYRSVLPPTMSKGMLRALLPMLGLNLALGFVIPGIDMNAHLGGLFGGAAGALFLTPDVLAASRPPAWTRHILPVTCISILTLSFTAAGQNIFRTRGPDGPVLPAWQVDALSRMQRDWTFEMLEEQLAKHPESRDLLTFRGQVRIGEEDWAGAISDFRAVLALSPDDAQAMNNLAWLLLEEAPPSLRDHVEATSLAERAREYLPEDPYILGTLGTARLRQGRTGEAETLLRRAIEAEPGRPGESTDRYLLAITLALNGRGDEARKELGRAVSLDPTDRYRAEAESLLAASHSVPAP
jgi:membrane associated rhomboid family serine protease/Tfp pilus assembly protein PilF